MKRSRSHSRSRRGTPSVKVEVPGFYLRGKGLTSYHLYTIKVSLALYSVCVYVRTYVRTCVHAWEHECVWRRLAQQDE